MTPLSLSHWASWRAGWVAHLFPILLGLVLMTWYAGAARNLTVELPGTGKIPILAHDDSYITLTYARNLAAGHGLRWHPAAEPVEGFSSFLWTVVAAPYFLINDHPFALLIMTCGLLHTLTAWLLYGTLVTLGLAARLASPLAAIVVVWPTLREQALAATEFPLLVAVLAVALRLAAAPHRSTSKTVAVVALAALLPLVRPEGALLTIAVLAFLLARSGRLDPKSAIPLLLLAFAPLALVIVFRLGYFGSPLPNTYYLKMTERPDRWLSGLRHMYGFLQSFPATLLLPPAAATVLLLGRREDRTVALSLAAVAAGLIHMGGDAWPIWRFYCGAFVLSVLLLGIAARRLCEDGTGRRGLIVGVALWSAAAAFLPGLWREGRVQAGLFPKPSPALHGLAQAGLDLKLACSSEARIAVFIAGVIPYFSELESIDMLGKCDRHIARAEPLAPGLPAGHDRVDYDYVLASAPDALFVDPIRGSDPAEVERLRRRGFGAYLAAFYTAPHGWPGYAGKELPGGSRLYALENSTVCQWSDLKAEAPDKPRSTAEAGEASP